MTVSKIICALDSGFLKSEDQFAYSDGTLRSAGMAKLIEWVNK